MDAKSRHRVSEGSRLVISPQSDSRRQINHEFRDEVSTRSGTRKYDLVIDDLIPREDSLFEFVVLSPGLSRDEGDLIVHQHDGSNWH